MYDTYLYIAITLQIFHITRQSEHIAQCDPNFFMARDVQANKNNFKRYSDMEETEKI